MCNQINDDNREILSALGNAVPSSETASHLYEEVLLNHKELIRNPEVVGKLPFNTPSFVVPDSWSPNTESYYDTSEDFYAK